MVSSIILLFLHFYLIESERSNQTVRQTRPLSSLSFDEIIIDGAFDIFLSETSNGTFSIPTVEIETTIVAQNGVIVQIIDNHTLFIHLNNSFVVDQNIYAYIRFPSPLRRYTIRGTGNLITDDRGITNESNETFLLDNQGVANIAIRLNVYSFEGYFTGTGNSRLAGQVREQALFDTKGIGDINALDLIVKKAQIRATGITIIRVTAIDDIQIEVNGVSTVYYRLTSGKKVNQTKTTGLGKIRHIS